MTGQNTVEIVVRLNTENFKKGVGEVQAGLEFLPRHVKRIIAEFSKLDGATTQATRAMAQRNTEAEKHANRRELQESKHTQKLAQIAEQSNARLTQIEQQKLSQLATIEARREAQVRRHAERLTEYQVNAAERARAKLTAIGNSIGQAFLTAGAFIAGKGLFDRVAEIDRLSKSLAVLEGSTEKANAKLKQLRALADSSVGLTRGTALEGFQQLKAIGGISDKTIDRTLQGVGRLGSVFKIDSQSDFLRNQVQIFSQGFERSDIKEALGRVPIFERILEQAFGTKDNKALKQLKESGKLTLDAYLSGIASAIENNPQLSQVQESIGARFEKLKDKALDAITPLGTSLFTVLGPGLEKIVEVVTKVGNAFSALPAEVQTAISLFAGLLGIIAAFGTGVGEVVAVIGLLYAAWQSNFGGIREITQQVFAFVTPFIQEQVNTIVGWWNDNLPLIKETTANVLKSVREFWAANGQDIINVARQAWNIVTTVVSTSLKNVLAVVRFAMQVYGGDWKGAHDTLAEVSKRGWDVTLTIIKAAGSLLWSLIKAIARNVWESFKDFLKAGYDIGHALGDGLINGIKAAATGVYNAAKGLALSAWNAAKSALGIQSPSKVFHTIGINIGEGLSLGIRSTAAQVKAAIGELVKETRETAQKAALFDVPGFVQAKTRQEVVGQIAATKQAQFDVSLFGNADFFAAKNAALDAENLKRLAEEVFELQRGLKELSNVPIPPALKALPTDEAGLKAIKDYDERLKALNEAVQKVKNGQIALNLSVKEFGETMGPIPDVIRHANEELSSTIDASQKAIAAYDKIKQGLEGVIDSASDAISGLTRSQKIAREIANLPADFDPTRRAELERLASQAQVAEQQQLALEKSRRIAEAITGTFDQAFRDGFERGPKAFFARIFEAGKETFSRLAASALATLTTNLLGGFLQKLTGIFRAPGQSTGGGIGSIFGGLFGGGGSSGGGFGSIINSTFGGGNLGGGVFSLLGGGGRSLLPVGASSLAGLALPTQLPSFISTGGAAANQALATATAAQGGGVLRGGLGNLISLAGLKNAFKGIGFGLPQGSAVGSLGQALPLLGVGLGASLGGQSKLGQIVGGVGGGLLGIGLTAAPAALGTTGIGGALAGLFSNPITAIVGGALLVGSYFLGKAKQRKADEKLVDTYWVEYMERLKQLTKDVNANRIDGDSAMQQALAARQEAIGLISQIKTASVRESRLKNQIPDVDRLFLEPLKDAIERQKARGANVQRIVPEFAMGGHVDRVLRAAGGLRGRVAAGRGWPHDDVAVRVSRDEAILNPIQIARLGAMMGTSGDHVLKMAGVPGYAAGRMPDGFGSIAASGQPIVLNLEIESRAIIGPTDAEGIVVRGIRSDKGGRVLVNEIKRARSNNDL